jgi:hypothetical protein
LEGRPFYSLALLYNASAEAGPSFLGTAFAFRHREFFLTASHCVGTLEARELRLVLPLIDEDDITIANIEHHSSADVSLLMAGSIPPSRLEPCVGLGGADNWGDPIQVLGYPEESSEEGVVPTARLLWGTIQRKFTHTSRLGYKYFAGETSFGAPAGISGGPVHSPSGLDHVVGVMTENHDSTTYLKSVEEVQADGQMYRERIHEVIRYGLYVSLAEIADWLDPLTI